MILVTGDAEGPGRHCDHALIPLEHIIGIHHDVGDAAGLKINHHIRHLPDFLGIAGAHVGPDKIAGAIETLHLALGRTAAGSHFLLLSLILIVSAVILRLGRSSDKGGEGKHNYFSHATSPGLIALAPLGGRVRSCTPRQVTGRTPG